MAETLTYENTTETTSVENLNADEQDSLQVGEAMIEQQEQLLAGKYKDAQELEKAYVELQKKLGDKGSGDSSEARDSPDSEQVESKENTEEKKETKKDIKGNVLDTLWEEALSNESYTKETIEALNKMSPVEIAAFDFSSPKSSCSYLALSSNAPFNITNGFSFLFDFL